MSEDIEKLKAENALLKEGLSHAIQAAELALFVIRKQGVMPNSSWRAGFEKDLKIAHNAQSGV